MNFGTRAEWLGLSQAERSDFVNRFGPAIGELVEAGIELVGFALNDADVPLRAQYRYIAVWKMFRPEPAQLLEAGVERAGRYNYFGHINARESIVSLQDALGDMVRL